MFQPFELFKPVYLQRLITLNKVYLVSQSYKAGFDHFDEENKTGILLTDYDDIGLANIHKNAVKLDKYASVMHLKNPKHLEKLEEMMAEKSSYKLFWSVVRDKASIEKRMEIKYKDNVRRYIMKNTNWRIGGHETIDTQLSVIFGEVFLLLKRGAQELRIKFEEIEKS